MKTRVVVLFTLAVSAFAASTLAHHSFSAEYDQSKPLTLSGKLTRIVSENPHGWIYLAVKNVSGKTVTWQLETPGPGVLDRNGLTRDVSNELVASGESVTVTAYAARDESKHAWAAGLTRADGRILSLGGVPSGPGGLGGGRGQ